MLKLPGLIDVHVHVREPGQPYKEDWESLTKAAVAGGFVAVLVMPNTDPAIVNSENYDLINNIAYRKAYCDYGIYLGANSTNYDEIKFLAHKACGVKLYLNVTFGTLLLENNSVIIQHILSWPIHKPMCVHAEGDTLENVINLVRIHNPDIHLHVCHVSSRKEIELIRDAKTTMNITCEVAPHHLFLDNNMIMGNQSLVKPPLMTSDDVNALWENLDIIDCFATDHAPHRLEDKECHKCPGFPGLETALPLLLQAVDDGRLTIQDIITKYHNNPI